MMGNDANGEPRMRFRGVIASLKSDEKFNNRIMTMGGAPLSGGSGGLSSGDLYSGAGGSQQQRVGAKIERSKRKTLVCPTLPAEEEDVLDPETNFFSITHDPRYQV